MTKNRKGWRGESRRHSLARRGIETVIDGGKRFDVSKFVSRGRFFVNVERYGTVEDIENRIMELELVVGHEAEFLKEYLGNHEDIEDFGGFLVKEKDGDYTEIYGFMGNVPYLNKYLYKIEWGIS